MTFMVISIVLAVALVIALFIIAEQKRIIEHQGKRLLEALDWIEPDALVREDWE